MARKFNPREYQKLVDENKIKVKTIEDLNPKQRAFADFIISGKSIVEAYTEAGYMKGKDMSLDKNRISAYQNGYALLQNPTVHNYVLMNSGRYQNDSLVIDESSLIERLNIIFNGNAEVKVMKKNGECVYIPPSFKDQIMAAQTLLQIIKMQERKIPVDTRVNVISKRMSELTDDIRKTALISSDFGD